MTGRIAHDQGYSMLTVHVVSHPLFSAGEGDSHIVWVGVCCWVRESPTIYQTK